MGKFKLIFLLVALQTDGAGVCKGDIPANTGVQYCDGAGITPAVVQQH